MKLSIITVNLNNREGLKKTIDSVVAQTFRDFEWIVIDGGSTDGSRELIEQYADHFAYWVSEPDKGIYNAMNKGIKVAKGEYLQFLNSGDWLCDEKVLQKVFDSGPDEQIVYGDCLESDGSLHVFPSSLDALYFYRDMLNHQASFIRSSLLEEGYDENYKYASDWLFFLQKIVFGNVSYRKVNHVIIGVQPGKSYNVAISDAERVSILNQLFPPLLKNSMEKLSAMTANPMRPYYDHIDANPKLGKWVRWLVRLHRRLNKGRKGD